MIKDDFYNDDDDNEYLSDSLAEDYVSRHDSHWFLSMGNLLLNIPKTERVTVIIEIDKLLIRKDTVTIIIQDSLIIT